MNTDELRGLLEEQLRLSRRLRARIRELEQAHAAPLAVVGIGLRLPGGITTPQEYRDFLYGKGDAIVDVPKDRPGLAAVYAPEVGRPGRSYVRRAGFLDHVAEFDADFFGISQREAEALDPQQRMLLETSWEAMERAGIARRRHDRLNAGVFIGIMAAEYTDRLAQGDPRCIDPYFGTGGGHCFAAGRISYVLGLRGPAMSIDTACSSALVALHAAARSLRARECRYALVGGANLLFSPQLMVSLCASRALAPDGRSKPFTAAADGYGRGEGVATVVLMRLEDAVEESRPVLAVLCGTAVNHDGASSGLTVPNGAAQQEVIRAALADAGVSPAAISYVEAHGTGTTLGDPIEVAALEEVLGSAREGESEKLLIGSIKTRIGHLEAASGLASLLKVVLMLGEDTIPVDVPEDDGALSPLIPWREYHLEVPRRPRPWPRRPKLAGISSFGLSGTNAHAVLRAADPPPQSSGTEVHRLELVLLSARSDVALTAAAAAVSTYLVRVPPGHLPSVAHTLRAGRVPFAHRIALIGTTTEQVARDLIHTPPTAVSSGATRPLSEVTLITNDATRSVLSEGLTTLAAEFPLLLGEPDPDPAAWLARALRGVGLSVRLRSVHATAAAPAQLEFARRRITLVPADRDSVERCFLEALAALFLAGADLRLDGLRRLGARFLPDVPTYPFQRRTFWIDEPTDDRAVTPETTQSVIPGAVTPAAEADARGDVDSIQRLLCEELAAVLGASADELNLELSFSEVGGDSFTAMLFFKSLEDRYQVTDLAKDFPVDQPLAESVRDLAVTLAQLDRSDVGAQVRP